MPKYPIVDRYHHPFFERARALLEPILSELGFVLAEEHYHQHAFGSAYAVYRRAETELRLVWDGKEGALAADVAISRNPSKYIDIESPNGAGKRIAGTEQTDARIERLAKVIRTAFADSKPQPRS
jgi:hypothetical protein